MPPAVRSAAAIICGSENSKRDIAKAYGIAPGKVRVIPYGVDHERFHAGATLNQKWAKSFGIRDGYVLHVGTFSYRKNIPTLLRAVALLRDKGKWGERQVVLAGSQNLSLKGAPEVFTTIRELDLSGCVVLTGHTPDEHVAGLYAHASMLVMPSLYEGFGFPVLEAMAAGTPVVSTTLGAEGLAVTQGKDIVIADTLEAMADAVVGLQDESPQWQQMAANARRLVQMKYDWSVVGEILWRLHTEEVAMGAACLKAT